MVEPEHLISQLLLDRGQPVLRLRYHECIKGPGRDVPRQIRNGTIVGICIAYHEWKKRIPAEIITKFHKEIEVWIRHAKTMNLDVIVVGLTGNHWKQSIWDNAIEQEYLYESKQALCFATETQDDRCTQQPLFESVKYF